jgi:hypothetical protein
VLSSRPSAASLSSRPSAASGGIWPTNTIDLPPFPRVIPTAVRRRRTQRRDLAQECNSALSFPARREICYELPFPACLPRLCRGSLNTKYQRLTTNSPPKPALGVVIPTERSLFVIPTDLSSAAPQGLHGGSPPPTNSPPTTCRSAKTFDFQLNGAIIFQALARFIMAGPQHQQVENG